MSAEIIAYLESELVKLKAQESPEPVKPDLSWVQWRISIFGNIDAATNYTDTEKQVLIYANNAFATEEEATAELMRRKSMAKKWKPEVGDKYWTVISSGDIQQLRWAKDSFDARQYLLGLTFQTREEAEDWKAEFCPYWEKIV